MQSNALKTWAAVALLALIGAAIAAPGTPIGGIIVKGGKNPGGQMRALATTDAAGKFRIRFAEGGEYTLEFGSASKDSAARTKAGLQVDYLIEHADGMATGGTPGAKASRHTPFHNKLEHGRMVVTVPKGGGELRGVLQASAVGKDAAARAITESGVSVSPSKPKGSIKK